MGEGARPIVRYEDLRERIVASFDDAAGHFGERLARTLLLLPDLLVLFGRLAEDPRLPEGERRRVKAVLLFLILPIDLIPELFLGPVGLVDDLAVAVFTLHALLNKVDPVVVRDQWPGDGDILEQVQEAVAELNRLFDDGPGPTLARWLGHGWRSLRAQVSGAPYEIPDRSMDPGRGTLGFGTVSPERAK